MGRNSVVDNGLILRFSLLLRFTNYNNSRNYYCQIKNAVPINQCGWFLFLTSKKS